MQEWVNGSHLRNLFFSLEKLRKKKKVILEFKSISCGYSNLREIELGKNKNQLLFISKVSENVGKKKKQYFRNSKKRMYSNIIYSLMYTLKGTIYSNYVYNVTTKKFRKDTWEQVCVFFLLILFI